MWVCVVLEVCGAQAGSSVRPECWWVVLVCPGLAPAGVVSGVGSAARSAVAVGVSRPWWVGAAGASRHYSNTEIPANTYAHAGGEAQPQRRQHHPRKALQYNTTRHTRKPLGEAQTHAITS